MCIFRFETFYDDCLHDLLVNFGLVELERVSVEYLIIGSIEVYLFVSLFYDFGVVFSEFIFLIIGIEYIMFDFDIDSLSPIFFLSRGFGFMFKFVFE